MSKNAGLVHRHLEARNRRDLDAILETFHPDAEIDFTRSHSPYRGVYRGREGWRELWERNDDAWAAVRWEAEELVEVNDDVVVTGRMRARGADSGAEVEARGAIVVSFRDDLIVRYGVYQTRREALEAVGLRE
jgi:ketosteroid isomerase-like protein